MLALLVAAVLGTAGVLGWRWLDRLPLQAIDVEGARHAERAALVELAAVDTSMKLFEVDPVIVADRLRRHPWVAAAEVTRLPTGTLRLQVQERRPAALVLDRQGAPAYFVDAAGFSMPLVKEAAYDVPLLRGLRAPYHPVQPLEDPSVRALLAALDAADPAARALVSELTLGRDGVWLHTTPRPGAGSVPVHLGQGDFAAKLVRLRAFWEQAVLTQPDRSFTLIDLRFDSQIVTQEKNSG